ncbi:MAG: hypothetical protein MJ089_06130 [Ruminococcus sp.]|nr:hypothetical protein [Ruminococcus sp.]
MNMKEYTQAEYEFICFAADMIMEHCDEVLKLIDEEQEGEKGERKYAA